MLLAFLYSKHSLLLHFFCYSPLLSPSLSSLMNTSVDMDVDSLMRKTFSVGEEVTGFLSDVSERGLLATLSPRATAFIPPMLISTDPAVRDRVVTDRSITYPNSFLNMDE